jgi:uncharacterized protein YbjT (DUF2867 family)
VAANVRPSPPAAEFFTTAARNLQRVGAENGVRLIVAVSIIGCDRFAGGYNAAKVAHEQAILAGPVLASILRAAQFHEFVDQLLAWARRGDVCYVTEMRSQLVAARTVAEVRVEGVSDPAGPDQELYASGGLLPSPHATLAGPRLEWVDMQVEVARAS